MLLALIPFRLGSERYAAASLEKNPRRTASLSSQILTIGNRVVLSVREALGLEDEANSELRSNERILKTDTAQLLSTQEAFYSVVSSSTWPSKTAVCIFLCTLFLRFSFRVFSFSSSPSTHGTQGSRPRSHSGTPCASYFKKSRHKQHKTGCIIFKNSQTPIHLCYEDDSTANDVRLPAYSIPHMYIQHIQSSMFSRQTKLADFAKKRRLKR